MLGEVLNGRYQLENLIGAGGMADVYRATDTLLGRTVAVKILHPQYAKDPVFIQRFRQEAQAAANLNHPNVVSVYDWGIEDTTYFLVMEYVEGRDLKEILVDGGPLLPERAVEIAISICSALEAAHAAGIIHRDIKPQNIVVTRDNQIKVMDFGIARAPGGSAMTQTGTIMGTAQYISPEQAQGQSADARSDIYSLGIVLYEMLTGRVPFEGETPVAIAYMHVREDPMPPSMINPDVSPELEAVVMKALSKNPENRYQSVVEMKADLDRCLEGAPVYATPILAHEAAAGATEVYPAAAARGKGGSRLWIWIVIIAVLLVGSGIGIWAIVSGTGGIEVPDVVGEKLDQAEETLKEKGLKLSVEKRVVDMDKPKDVIISQDPKAGGKISKGGTVKVTVSKGAETVSVPDVVGLSQSEASSRLEEAGLELGDVREEYSQGAKGAIVAQQPAAGEEASKGSSVDVVVSKGPETVTIPNVVNLTEENARQRLSDAGLSADVEEVKTTEHTEGKVFEQSPESGTKLPKGATVNIKVAVEPEEVEVPNLEDLTQSEAESRLSELGLKVRVSEKDTSAEDEVGKVIEQDPAAGTKVDENTTVTIYIGVLVNNGE